MADGHALRHEQPAFQPIYAGVDRNGRRSEATDPTANGAGL